MGQQNVNQEFLHVKSLVATSNSSSDTVTQSLGGKIVGERIRGPTNVLTQHFSGLKMLDATSSSSIDPVSQSVGNNKKCGKE